MLAAGCPLPRPFFVSPRKLCAHLSENGWECYGWRRELGDSEVAESFMDAKFGGEGADMTEIVAGW